MKVAITGGTSVVGRSFVSSFSRRGYEVVNVSRSLGYNFKDVDSIVSTIIPCDIFVNCLSLDNLQRILLDRVWSNWKNQNKKIINISTCNTLPAFGSKNPKYHQEKLLLEEHHWKCVKETINSPVMCLVKLGDGNDSANWDHCVEYTVNAIETVSPSYLFEISVFK